MDAGTKEFKIGQRVWHDAFGAGIVLAISNNKDSWRTITVDFGRYGHRTLLLHFSNLKAV